jgi:hypothetical protein
VRRRAGKAWDKLGPFQRIGLVVLGLLLAALAYLFVLKWLPEWLTNNDLTGKDRAEDEGRNRTAVLATIAGMIAIAGAIFTALSYRLNRAGQITERFTRAIDQLGATDQLGKPKIDVVLGGIYALERIAKDSRDDHPQVVEVLTAYVREHARYKPEPQAPTTSGEQGQDDEVTTPDDVQGPPLETDIQAAMDVLARRDITQDRDHHHLNLVGTDLRTLVLDAREGGHLETASLQGAHLVGAWLQEAHLEKASLQEAHLEGAYLAGAHLEGANLAGAHLETASLQGAHLEEAYLGGAHLGGAVLINTHYDDRTHWPTPEFEAKALARGALRVDDDDEDRSAETV